MPTYDGNTVRFTADDHPAGSLQREVAESVDRWRDAERASVAVPTLSQILDGLPHIKAYNARIENAWRDPDRGGRT